MRLPALALVLLSALGLAAPGASDGGTRVESFSPLGSIGRVEQVRVRFNRPIVPFGDLRRPAPIEGDCSAGVAGRWVDDRSYAIDLPRPLPGGLRCTYRLRAGLRDAAGGAVAGARSFAFDTGGPSVVAVLPSPGGGVITEDQVFLFATNGAATRDSIAAAASCRIEGVGEVVPLDVLPDAARDAVVKGDPDWAARAFLAEAGWRKPEYGDDAPRPRAAVFAARCRRALPADGRVALLWGAGVRSASGLATIAAQRFDYRVRAPFTARLTCSRENAAAPCSPVEAIRLEFAGEVPLERAMAVRLVAPDGREAAPERPEGRVATVSSLSWPALHAQGAHRVVLPDGFADFEGRPLANAARFPLAVAVGAPPPLVKFAGTFGILEAEEGGVLPVTVRRVEPRLAGLVSGPVGGRVFSARTDAEVAAWLRRLEEAEERTQVEEPIAGGDATRSIETTRGTPLIAPGAAARRIAVPHAAGGMQVVGIPLGTKGFHVVELASPVLGRALLGRGGTRYVASGALVTDMAVHFQWGMGRSLVWVTRLSDARPVGGAEVAVTNSCTGAPLWRGRTDASGRALIGDVLPTPEPYGSCKYGAAPLMASARAGGDYSFTLTSWNSGIQPGDFRLDTGYGFARDAAVTVFSRTLLRAGETVEMKHILRRRTDAGFGWPDAMRDPEVTIRHLGSDQTWRIPLGLARGSGETRWAVPRDAALGDYQVEIGAKGAADRRVSGTFAVEEFRLPTVRARVSGPKGPQVAVRGVPLDLTLAYLSGGAVSRAPVTLRTQVEPRDISVPGYEDWSFAGEELREGVIADAGEEGGARGPLRARIDPVVLNAQGAARVAVDVPAVTRPSVLVAEMDYDDANGERATTGARVSVDPAAVRVGIATDGWMAKADDLRVKLAVLDLENRPMANARVTVRAWSREIYSVRKRLVGGFYAYDNRTETKRLGAECSGSTDARGLLTCRLDPGVSGEVIAEAVTRDAAGRAARATRSVWLTGDDDWWFGGDNGDRMDVVPEAAEYAAGATARFQVRMPFRRATALVSVLRDGVIDSYVTEISGKDAVVTVPLKRGYAPDVYVSVLAVRGRVSGWRLWLADLARRWNLPWISRDAGAPTALVDLAKPAYRFGMAKVRVGWDDHRLAVRVATDRPSYAVRQMARASVQVAAPRGRTLPADAEVAFAAVDEALLQLKPNESWKLLDAMMADRPVMVQTSTAQGQVVGKRHYGAKAVAAGGGGGVGEGLTRRDFQPLLLWRGRVPLDAAGRAVVDVPLNDSLSGFRLVAVATAGPDLFGTGEASIRTTQDLQILPGIPPLAREGDRFVATLLLRNTTAAPMRVALTGRLGAGPLPPLTLTVPAAGAATARFPVTAGTAGTLTWAVDARAGAARDSVRVVQRVLPAVPLAVLQSTLVQLDPQAALPVATPAGALPGRGGIGLGFSATLGGSLPGVRAYMAAYPYNCLEQMFSRAVATDDRGGWDAAAAALPAYLDRDGLARFYPADWIAGDTELTAYLLRLSAERGWPLPAAARERMVAGLGGVLAGRIARPGAEVTAGARDGDSRRLAIIAALAAAGVADARLLEAVPGNPDAWPTAAVIDWAYALRRLNPDAALLARARQVLAARLDLQGTRLTLARAESPSLLLASQDVTAARLVQLASEMPGFEADAGRIARGLMLRQQRGHWDTTVANAVGTLAMRAFGARYERGAVTGATEAVMGGARANIAWPAARAVELPWPTAPATLLLRHAGTGAPWAIVTSRAAVPLTRPVASGFAVQRAVSAVAQAVPGRWSRGDVMRVRVTVTPRAPVRWVVVNDPVPTGATILGGSLGGRSAILDGSQSDAGAQPAYVERRTDAVHAHYAELSRAAFTYEYTLRLNSEGAFRLPPTRVEALYSPEMMAMVPNAPVTVGPAAR